MGDEIKMKLTGGRPTISDVARLAGVSKKTVSRVINESPSVSEATRKAVQTIIRETGYVPDPQARGLAFRRSFLVGLIYDDSNPQHTISLQQGLLEAMDGSGFELVVRSVDRASPTLLDDVRAFVERQKLYGMVLPPPISEDERLVALLTELDCRYVRIGPAPLDGAERMVVGHDRVGAARAARHLADLGHTRIALISGPAGLRASQERREGFEGGLAERGLKLTPDGGRQVDGGYEAGVAVARELLLSPTPPTAVFCLNDEMAAGVYQAARERGMEIPRDLSVVGFDDAAVAARLWPPLTTVRLPLRDMGRTAGEKLVPNPMRDKPSTWPDIEPELIVRNSTARPA